ncbi:MAG: hypothetical protein K0Q71_5334, partial [Thermomicrobiales bacterium]|nr:hypothetical protein [Thermomicrobiales bacterium]
NISGTAGGACKNSSCRRARPASRRPTTAAGMTHVIPKNEESRSWWAGGDHAQPVIRLFHLTRITDATTGFSVTFLVRSQPCSRMTRRSRARSTTDIPEVSSRERRGLALDEGQAGGQRRDLGDMPFDRAYADEELRSDLPIRKPLTCESFHPWISSRCHALRGGPGPARPITATNPRRAGHPDLRIRTHMLDGP